MGTFHNKDICPHNKVIEYKDRKYFDLKSKLVEYYGPCYCCGETNIRFLSIDHINGGGRQHKKEFSSHYGVYEHIINSNFPEEYRIACLNCNCGREIAGGTCPHEYMLMEKNENFD